MGKGIEGADFFLAFEKKRTRAVPDALGFCLSLQRIFMPCFLTLSYTSVTCFSMHSIMSERAFMIVGHWWTFLNILHFARARICVLIFNISAIPLCPCKIWQYPLLLHLECEITVKVNMNDFKYHLLFGCSYNQHLLCVNVMKGSNNLFTKIFILTKYPVRLN